MARRGLWLMWMSGVCATVAIGHLVRAAVGASVTVGGTMIPLWVSWLVSLVAAVASLGLGIWAHRTSARCIADLEAAAKLAAYRPATLPADALAPCCGMHAVIKAGDDDDDFVDEENGIGVS